MRQDGAIFSPHLIPSGALVCSFFVCIAVNYGIVRGPRESDEFMLQEVINVAVHKLR